MQLRLFTKRTHADKEIRERTRGLKGLECLSSLGPVGRASAPKPLFSARKKFNPSLAYLSHKVASFKSLHSLNTSALWMVSSAFCEAPTVLANSLSASKIRLRFDSSEAQK